MQGGGEKPFVLVICDISGYTSFVSHHAEVKNHGFVIVGQLLSAMMRAAEPVLKVSKLEGDAVFLYAPLTGDGARLSDHMSAALARCDVVYHAFERRLKELREANICACEACLGLERLQLKIVVHSGPVLLQKIGRYHEVVGADVIRVHRLLKNQVPLREYLLLTETVCRCLDGDTPAARYAGEETDPDLGPCRVEAYALPWKTSSEAPSGSYRSLRYQAADIMKKIFIGRLFQLGLLRRS